MITEPPVSFTAEHVGRGKARRAASHDHDGLGRLFGLPALRLLCQFARFRGGFGGGLIKLFMNIRPFRPPFSTRQQAIESSAGMPATPLHVLRLKQAWCCGQRTVSSTTKLSASGP